MQHYFSIIRYRIMIDFKNELHRSHLGMLWWILEPIMYLGAFYVVFETVFKRGGPGFVGFLLVGLMFWRWFDNSVKRAATSILGNASLIRQVSLPKLLYPATELGGALVRFLFVLPILLLFVLFYTGSLSASVLWLPLLMLIQFLASASIACLLAALIPFATDLRKLMDHGLMLMFYLSGIFFDIDKAPEHIQTLLYLNPMAVLIQGYRKILLLGEAPELMPLLLIAATSTGLLLLSITLIRRFDALYARILA